MSQPAAHRGDAAAARQQLVRAQRLRHLLTYAFPDVAVQARIELRLLPLLSTHVSFAEIGAELFLSPNTAKTHAVSIYRKLGASNRSQAISQARELGLLEG